MWDRKGYRADIWSNFDQVAHYISGQLKVMFKHCREILNHPDSIIPSTSGKQGTIALRRHLTRATCKRRENDQANTAPELFNEARGEHQIVASITNLRLPFATIEHPEFLILIQIAQQAPSTLILLSRRTMQRRILSKAQDLQKEILQKLPPKAFMAVSGYFINTEWEYRELLEKGGIKERVLAGTTDNASNNSTLISTLKDSILSPGLGSNIIIIRIPHLAPLLDQMKANTINENIDFVLSEKRARIAGQTMSEYSMTNTLKNIQNLAIFINASPIRRDCFQNLQKKAPRLVSIQDVRTHWDSAILMLRRARKLHIFFEKKRIRREKQIPEALRSAESKLKDISLSFVQGPDWQDEEKDHAAQWKKGLEDQMKEYQEKLYESISQTEGLQHAKPVTHGHMDAG
ncbi:uncharacterized protein N7511_008359 [Penicillium nucicola]|uniref:uncharacterized protein n=1 Tax=Penicillium nucicola TaxID=1850975 RepID=UPI0025454D27|nr:uncharacterized protein N7511_008359 [Penicillium nucicola]KAJ5751394.1 hypothetical protein N7511_008359 [Penicillium nucicola]